jgi:hypothetical protein
LELGLHLPLMEFGDEGQSFARLGDGWLASAYNTTPDGFRAAKQSLSEQLDARGKDPDRFPNALATMWTWISRLRSGDRQNVVDVAGEM